ncbi:MAG: SRPBCC domain-containing protein [Candidatus Eremiobacteraeota bacterium]|nr:SRPBCC domain-containing protein [Candidatus Eremiobacteraeota bacterium]
MSDLQAATIPALVVHRTYPAPASRVYEAWTRPELVRQWFQPGDNPITNVEMDVRPGGRYRITFRMQDGEDWTVGGVYREVRAPERLSFTWQWEGDEAEMLVTLEFREQGEATELVLTHERFAEEASRERHGHGWNDGLDKLGAFLEPAKGSA